MTAGDHIHQTYGLVNISPQVSHIHSFNSNYVLSPPIGYSREIEYGILHSNNILYEHIIKEAQEKPMSTLDKIKMERREKREREELEAKFQEWDAIFASERADVGFFTRDIGDKTYRYAALCADKRWYLTGLETRAFAVEDFIAWLIEKDVLPENFVWLETIGD